MSVGFAAVVIDRDGEVNFRNGEVNLGTGSRVGGGPVSAPALVGCDILSGNAHDGKASKNGVKPLSFRMPFH